MPSQRVFIPLAATCLLTGCVEHAVQGNEITFRHAWWLGPAVLGAACLMLWGAEKIPAGPAVAAQRNFDRTHWLSLRFHPANAKFALVILSLVLFFYFAPLAFERRVTVRDEGFEARLGTIFFPDSHDIRFGDLAVIRYEIGRTTRGKPRPELRCRTKAGPEIVLPAGDVLKAAVPEILRHARARGVAAFGEGE